MSDNILIPAAQRTEDTMLELCRMHEAPLPRPRQIVIGTVTNVRNTEIYLTLLEYNGLAALLPLSLIAARRIRSVSSYVKPNKLMILEVGRIDPGLMHVDLDERSVRPEDKEACRARYLNLSAIHSLMRHVCLGLEIPRLIYAYKIFGWPVARGKYDGDVMAAFKRATVAFEEVFAEAIDRYYAEGYIETEEERAGNWLQMDGLTVEDLNYIRASVPKDKLLSAIRSVITTRLRPRPHKIAADLRLVSLYDIRGVELIKSALAAGQAYADAHPITAPEGTADEIRPTQQEEEEVPLAIRLSVAPTYSLALTTLYVDKGKQLMEEVIKVISDASERLDLQFTVEKEVTATEQA